MHLDGVPNLAAPLSVIRADLGSCRPLVALMDGSVLLSFVTLPSRERLVTQAEDGQ